MSDFIKRFYPCIIVVTIILIGAIFAMIYVSNNQSTMAAETQRLNTNTTNYKTSINEYKIGLDDKVSAEKVNTLQRDGKALADAEMDLTKYCVNSINKDSASTDLIISKTIKESVNISKLLSPKIKNEQCNQTWSRSANTKIVFESDFDYTDSDCNVMWTVYKDEKMTGFVTGVYDFTNEYFDEIEIHNVY